jgi:WD40 repeat protein
MNELSGLSLHCPTMNTLLVYLPPSSLTLASADKTICLWRGDKKVRTFSKHTDVVRGLCEIPGLGFASCGNDAYALLGFN